MLAGWLHKLLCRTGRGRASAEFFAHGFGELVEKNAADGSCTHAFGGEFAVFIANVFKRDLVGNLLAVLLDFLSSLVFSGEGRNQGRNACDFLHGRDLLLRGLIDFSLGDDKVDGFRGFNLEPRKRRLLPAHEPGALAVRQIERREGKISLPAGNGLFLLRGKLHAAGRIEGAGLGADAGVAGHEAGERLEADLAALDFNIGSNRGDAEFACSVEAAAAQAAREVDRAEASLGRGKIFDRQIELRNRCRADRADAFVAIVERAVGDGGLSNLPRPGGGARFSLAAWLCFSLSLRLRSGAGKLRKIDARLRHDGIDDGARERDKRHIGGALRGVDGIELERRRLEGRKR